MVAASEFANWRIIYVFQGRSVILHNINGTRVAQCVIGRNDNSGVERIASMVPGNQYSAVTDTS
jgi:hypothetical protein